MNNTTEVQFLEELQGKIVVADTSALLASGVDLLDYLDSSTLVIPTIVVSELEGKRTSGSVGFYAREWLRLLEELRTEFGTKLCEGVDYNGVMIKVQPNHNSEQCLPFHLRNHTADTTILAVAQNTKFEVDPAEVVLVTNDVPMRLHATLSLNLAAVPFGPAAATGVTPSTGRVNLTVSEELAAGSNSLVSGGAVSTDDSDYLRELVHEESEASHSLATVSFPTGDKVGDFLVTPNGVKLIGKCSRVSGIKPRTIEQKVAIEYLRMNPNDLPIVSLGGGAGTGKTVLSTAVGLEEVFHNSEYEKIAIFRSLHEMGKGQEMGFLPGDVDEKMGPWKGAIEDALYAIRNESRQAPTDDELKKVLEVSPITYLRGRTLADTYVILEEAQNFSRNEILNVISRLGAGSKLVMTFDAAQVDNRYLLSGSQADVWSVVNRLSSEDLFAHITLTKTERSPAAELAANVLSE